MWRRLPFAAATARLAHNVTWGDLKDDFIKEEIKITKAPTTKILVGLDNSTMEQVQQQRSKLENFELLRFCHNKEIAILNQKLEAM